MTEFLEAQFVPAQLNNAPEGIALSCFGIITGQHGHFDGGGVESAQVRETTVTQAFLIEFHSVDVDQTEVPLFGMGPNQYVALSQIEMLHPLEVELDRKSTRLNSVTSASRM